MNPDIELANMMIAWANAVGPAKDALFNNIINFMVNNPGVGQNIIRGGGAFATAYAAASRIPFSVFLARLAANFGASPKGPNPWLIACVVFGSVVITSSQARAETMDRQNALPSYELYVKNYMFRMAQGKKFHPQNNAYPSPKTFDEWYQEDRQ